MKIIVRREKREIKIKLQWLEPVKSFVFPTRVGATNKPMLEQVERTPNPNPTFSIFNITGGRE